MKNRLLNAVKAFNSEWDVGRIGDSSDGCGNFYHTYYIVGFSKPKRIDCLAIAKYCGMKYSNGFFYEKIV